MQRAWVQSLVRELRSHTPHIVAKKKKKERKERKKLMWCLFIAKLSSSPKHWPSSCMLQKADLLQGPVEWQTPPRLGRWEVSETGPELPSLHPWEVWVSVSQAFLPEVTWESRPSHLSPHSSFEMERFHLGSQVCRFDFFFFFQLYMDHLNYLLVLTERILTWACGKSEVRDQ